jgi:lipopolysaccharide transport system ATP-binding protein
MKPILEINNISKKFRIHHENHSYLNIRDRIANLFNSGATTEEFWALKDVSFNVMPGETIGIIGKNGAGKSTLLKILSKITPPTSGKIISRGRIASLLEVGTGFHGELSGSENIFLNGSILGMKRAEILKQFDAIVDFAGVEKFIDTPLKHYSSGMQLRLAFAVAAFLEPEILIIDEVLAVGDAEFQKKCLGKMEDVSKNQGRTVLFVSHNIGALHSICKKGIVLTNGTVDFESNISEATHHYLKTLSHSSTKTGLEPHILYKDLVSTENKKDLLITKIELLDNEGHAKPVVCTWDKFVIRIGFYSKKVFHRGSAVIQFKTLQGEKIFLLSTQPDSNLPMIILEGHGEIECLFEKIPLAAGDYSISVGFAVPNSEWLLWHENITQLTISPKDVYKSGLAPSQDRSLIAIEHQWREPKKHL